MQSSTLILTKHYSFIFDMCTFWVIYKEQSRLTWLRIGAAHQSRQIRRSRWIIQSAGWETLSIFGKYSLILFFCLIPFCNISKILYKYFKDPDIHFKGHNILMNCYCHCLNWLNVSCFRFYISTFRSYL